MNTDYSPYSVRICAIDFAEKFISAGSRRLSSIPSHRPKSIYTDISRPRSIIFPGQHPDTDFPVYFSVQRFRNILSQPRPDFKWNAWTPSCGFVRRESPNAVAVLGRQRFRSKTVRDRLTARGSRGLVFGREPIIILIFQSVWKSINNVHMYVYIYIMRTGRANRNYN